MALNPNEIEFIVDEVIEDVLNLAIASNFTKLKEIEYALEYLKTKIDEVDPADFTS